MKRTTLIGLAASVFLLAGAIQAQTFTGIDLGSPLLSGSATDNGDGTMTIVGGGADIWGTADSGFYYYTTMSDPVWDAVVRVRDLVNHDDAGTGTIGDDGWTKCELMVRLPDEWAGMPMADDPFIANMTTRSGGQNQIGPQWRTARAGNADWNALGLTIRPDYPNVWLKIERREALFTLYYGTDGATWNKYVDIDTSKSDLVGADMPYLTKQRVRVWSPGHHAFNASVQAIHDTMKALQDGMPPPKLAGVDGKELMDWVTRAADYDAHGKKYLA